MPLAESCRTSPTVSPQQASSGGARYRSPDRQPQLTHVQWVKWGESVCGYCELWRSWDVESWSLESVVKLWVVSVVVGLVELAVMGIGWLVIVGLSRCES